jgi:hypothetical protein
VVVTVVLCANAPETISAAAAPARSKRFIENLLKVNAQCGR